MAYKSMSLNVNGAFCEKFVDELGLLRFHTAIHSVFMDELRQSYGDGTLEEVGVSYLDLDVYNDGSFNGVRLSALQSDQATYTAWQSLVKKAKVTLRHEKGSFTQLRSDWEFHLDVGVTTPLNIEIIIAIEEGSVVAATLYGNEDVNLEHELTAFALRRL